jgi:hypothetical protein
MSFVFGTLQASAYSTFFLGIWAIGISVVMSLFSMAAILLSRFSFSPDELGTRFGIQGGMLRM